MISSIFGTSIEDYDVFEEIGRGGFGKVDRAKCRNTNKDVAIKKIDKISLVDEKFIERVRQEVSIHSKLDHPSILKLYTFFEDDDFVYIILELCPNGHLDQRIKRNRRPFYEKEAQDFLAQVVDGMLYLHSRGIMHRDLTLTNLLLDSKERVKIADFGLATQLKSPEEKHMTMCGTPNYISPEVASKKSHGLEADVWNFGCLIYTMLVGKPPFEGKFVRATLNNVMYGNYKIPDHLSDSSQDLISKCLKKNPRERIKLIDVLRHSFFESLHEGRSYNNTCRSDSGVYTISTNATTTHHTRTPLSAVCEYPEKYSYEDSAVRSHDDYGQNQINRPLNSPPVKLKANSRENYHQHGGMFGQLKKKFGGLPFINRNDPMEFPSDPRSFPPKFSNGNENYECPRETSRTSGRSSSKNQDADDHLYKDMYGSGSNHSCDRYEENKRQVPRHPRSSMKKGEENHRRSISSDGLISSYQKNQCHIVRSNSLDRDVYQEGICNDKNFNTHHSNCQCSFCYQRKQMCSCCRGHNDHRSWCDRNYHANNRNHPSNSPSKHSTKSSNSGSRNTDILKDIAPVKRSVTPPCVSSESVQRKGDTNAEKKTLLGQCSPLSSRRLRPTRQQTKNVILNVLDDGEVCVEFLQSKKSVKRVHDVCRISQDGLKIILYKPNNSSGVPVSDGPPVIPADGADAIFDYSNLPQKYWKKYIYAARFVKLVRAKTPKITYYSEQAKCFLMENSPNSDFEALFYSGEKLVISNGKVQVLERVGTTSSYDETECLDIPNETLALLYQHAVKVKRHCLMLEELLTQMENSEGMPNFPIIIGRRPAAPGCNSDPHQKRGGDEKENFSPLSVQSSRLQSAAGQLGPYEGSMSSVVTIDNGFPRQRKPLTPSQDINMLTNQKNSDGELFVENIGTAYKDHKRIMVNYLDGTSLEIEAHQPSYMLYTDSCNKKYTYYKDAVPNSLLKKVWQFNEAIARFSTSGNHFQVPKQSHSLKRPVIKNGITNLPKYLR